MAERAHAMTGLSRRTALKASVAGAALAALVPRPVFAQTRAAAPADFLTNLPGRGRTALGGAGRLVLGPFDVGGREPGRRRAVGGGAAGAAGATGRGNSSSFPSTSRAASRASGGRSG